jgi:hypothetical protein
MSLSGGSLRARRRIRDLDVSLESQILRSRVPQDDIRTGIGLEAYGMLYFVLRIRRAQVREFRQQVVMRFETVRADLPVR